MKISLIVVGKTDASCISGAIEEYRKRLSHYISFEIRLVPDLKNTGNLTEEQQKEREGDLILKQVQPGDFLVLLDDKGVEYTSLQFAAYIERKMQTVGKRLVFVVGGPYGFSSGMYAAAREKISFSRMTFSHQMIRLIFTEQLYRAMTILNREPYHHE
jgi:23S rRNA (pseudouridine1915-N3)-methyltransferase